MLVTSNREQSEVTKESPWNELANLTPSALDGEWCTVTYVSLSQGPRTGDQFIQSVTRQLQQKCSSLQMHTLNFNPLIMWVYTVSAIGLACPMKIPGIKTCKFMIIVCVHLRTIFTIVLGLACHYCSCRVYLNRHIP